MSLLPVILLPALLIVLGGCTSLSNYRSAFGPEGPQTILATSNAGQPHTGEEASVVPEGELRVAVNADRSVTVGMKAFPGGASLDWQATLLQTPRFAAAVDAAVEYTQRGSLLLDDTVVRYFTVAPAALASYRATRWLELTLMLRTPLTLSSGPEFNPLFGGNLTVKIGDTLGFLPQVGYYVDLTGRDYFNLGVGMYAIFAQR